MLIGQRCNKENDRLDLNGHFLNLRGCNKNAASCHLLKRFALYSYYIHKKNSDFSPIMLSLV